MRISDWSSDVCSSDLAGFYYWFPKISGRQLNEFLGQVHFWVFFIGVNVLFFPMHFLGMSGMPRRIPDYTGAYAYWNQIASLGYVIMASRPEERRVGKGRVSTCRSRGSPCH